MLAIYQEIFLTRFHNNILHIKGKTNRAIVPENILFSKHARTHQHERTFVHCILCNI